MLKTRESIVIKLIKTDRQLVTFRLPIRFEAHGRYILFLTATYIFFLVSLNPLQLETKQVNVAMV